MKSLRLVAIAAAMSAVAGTAFADDAVVKDGYAFDQNKLIPTGVRAEVGTTGYGGAISYNANPHVGVTLGYNGGDVSWTDDVKIDGSKYDLDMDNNNVYLNAEIRPWANWFYVATGVAYLDNDYDLDRRVGANEGFTVNNTDFVAGADGARINGKFKYKNDIVPYAGIGFSPAITNRWGVFGEVGAYYTGNPTAKLTGVGGTVADQALLADHERNIENDDEYQWLPVGKVGVSFHW